MMAMTQAEFKSRVEKTAKGSLRDDDGLRYDAKSIHELVEKNLAVAREFIEKSTKSRPGGEDLLLLAAVTSAYQLATGDGSYWYPLETIAQDISYIAYELFKIGTSYHQVDLWEPLPERTAALENWLVSGREHGVCDLCRAPLPRGSGFLLRRGPLEMGEFEGQKLRIDLGDEIFCDRCFDQPQFRKGRPHFKPRTLTQWDQIRGVSGKAGSFIHYSPPNIPSGFFEREAAGPSLDDLHKWIEDHRSPGAPPLSFEVRRSLLRLAGRTVKPPREQFEAWTQWDGRLQQEAERAVQIRSTDPQHALLLGRSILLLSSIITAPLFKFQTLMSLRLLFQANDQDFERSEVLAQMTAAIYSLIERSTGSDRADREGLLLLALSELTECLSRNGRHEEALARALEWLAAANTMRGREAAREPRTWVATSLYRLGKYELAKAALETNGINLIMWLDLDEEIDESDDKTWKQGLLYGQIQRATGELSLAIALLSRLVERVPEPVQKLDAAIAFSELGFALDDVGHYENAAAKFRQAALLADEVGATVLKEHWVNCANRVGSQREIDIYDTEVANKDFIESLRARENTARNENNLLELTNVLANLALKSAPGDDERLFEEALRTSDNRTGPAGILRLHAMFAGRLFATNRFLECRKLLDRAQGRLEQVMSTNTDSASRQELMSTLFDLLDVRTELAAHEGKWPEVFAYGEQFRARNLSRWMKIASLADDTDSDEVRGDMLARTIQEHRTVEVEAEVRHLTGDAEGASLHELNQRRRRAAEYIQRQQRDQGRLGADLDQHIPPWDQIFDKLIGILEPGVGLLSFVSSRRRIVWTLASKDHKTDQLMLGGARPIDEVDPNSGVPLFRNWSYKIRAAVSERVQRQLGDAGAMRDLIPAHQTDPNNLPEGLDALSPWKQELELIAQAVRRRGLKRLFIVPHRELARLPFWGLADQCELDAISIVPSVEVTAACLMRNRNVGGDSLLIPDRTAELRFARRELAEVSSVRARHGTVRRVEDYNLFRENSQDASVIHVAAHGYFNVDNPYDSGFGVGPTDAARGYFDRFTQMNKFHPSRKPEADGMRLLTVAMAMTELRLRACRLVVISACESGVPRIHGGGELTGLPNAFLLAGAKSVIASLWKVDDRATYLLMRYFYEEWTGGCGAEPSPAVALAKGRQRLRQTDRATAVTILGSDAPSDFAGEYPFQHPGFADAFHCYGAW